MTKETLSLIVKGKKTTQSVDIHPETQTNFVTLSDDDAITGIIPYKYLALSSPKETVIFRIKGAKINEITNSHGDLLFFEYMGVRNQQVEVEYFLGEMVRKYNTKI